MEKDNFNKIIRVEEKTHIHEVERAVIVARDDENRKQVCKLLEDGVKALNANDIFCAENLYQKMNRAYDSMLTSDKILYEQILEFNVKIAKSRK